METEALSEAKYLPFMYQNLWEDSNEKIIIVALGEIARRQVGRLGHDCRSGYQQEGGANYQ